MGDRHLKFYETRDNLAVRWPLQSALNVAERARSRDESGVTVAQLGQLEAAVMERLWDWDRPVSVRDVLDDLNRDRALAYTTVMTVLDNLHRKGMVLREKSGRAYVYRPTRSRASHTAELMEQVLANNPDRSGALLRFVEQLSARDVEALRQVVEAADPRRRKS